MTSKAWTGEVHTRDLPVGWSATLHREDGTAVSAWGATEDAAERRLSQVLQDA